jgi:multiple sugar transport system permease protein
MKRRLTLQERRGNKGYIYIAPFFIGFLLFNLFPMVFSFVISFTNWDALRRLDTVDFVGFGNYVDLFTNDERFVLATSNTLIFMVMSMITGISLSLIMAAVLCEKIPGNQTFRIVFYLPYLVIPVAFGMMMKPVFGAENYGLLNNLLKGFGIKAIYWLEDPRIAIWTVVFMNLWFVGGSMIIFLAGIKGIPGSYFEAAEIDGAGWWKKHIHITLPLLGPVIFFQVIMGLIWGLQIFDIPAALAQIGASTKTSMGIKDSLATLLFYLYFRGFKYWEFGAGAAIGWIVFVIGLAMTIIIILFIKRNKRLDIEI